MQACNARPASLTEADKIGGTLSTLALRASKCFKSDGDRIPRISIYSAWNLSEATPIRMQYTQAMYIPGTRPCRASESSTLAISSPNSPPRRQKASACDRSPGIGGDAWLAMVAALERFMTKQRHMRPPTTTTNPPPPQTPEGNSRTYGKAKLSQHMQVLQFVGALFLRQTHEPHHTRPHPVLQTV